MRRHRKRQKKIITLGIIGIICMLGVGYAAFSTNFLISGKGTIIERSRMIQNWTSSSNEDFHSDFYKENIVSATFLDSNAIPSNAVKSWDVSVDKDGGVMAYVVESSAETGKYDLYIGANDGVIANADSQYLFFQFLNIKSIETGNNYDTSNTTNMNSMFRQCLSLKKLDLSSFNTSKVTNMTHMFSTWTEETGIKNSSLEEITFGEMWNTRNVTNMHDMFVGLNSLKTLDLSKFDTSNLVDASFMFHRCSSLRELNLCSFDTSKVTSMESMFSITPNLQKIYVGSNWTIANAYTSSMFNGSGVSAVTTGEC